MTILSNFVVGIILIVMGLLVAKYPGLINTITKEEREKTDMPAVGRMMRKWLIGMGICQIIAAYFFLKLGVWEMKTLFDILLVMVGCIIMVAKSQKYKL